MLSSRFFSTGVLSALMLASSSAIFPAQKPTPLPITAAVDYVRAEAYGPIASVSPDGTTVVFAVALARTHGQQLHVLSLKDSSTRALTDLTDDAWGPAWSPDGRSVVFFMRRGGSRIGGLWIWQKDTGEMRRVSPASVAPAPPWVRPVWTPDGRSVLLPLAATSGMGADAPPLSPPKVRIFRANRPNAESALPSDLPRFADGIGIIDVRTGDVRKLGSGEVGGYQLDRTGHHLAALERSPRRDPNRFEVEYRLHVIDVATGISRTLSESVTTAYGEISWSPNGQHLAWVNDYAPEVGPAYLATVADGVVRKVQAPRDVTFAPKPNAGKVPLWDDTSARLFLVGNGGLWIAEPGDPVARPVTSSDDWKVIEVLPGLVPGTAASVDGFKSVFATVYDPRTLREAFARIDLKSGAIKLLMSADMHFGGPGGINKPVVLPDRKQVIYTAQAANQTEALWLSDLHFRVPRRLHAFNRSLEDLRFSSSRLVPYSNSRNESLLGVMLDPLNCKKDCPVVVYVYAEPTGGKGKNVFGLDPDGRGHIYATRDYAVFVPDTNLRVGSPAADLVDDMEHAIDALIRTGIIDPKKIVTEGHSYGGYNVLILITHTNRYAAAISASAFSDLASAIYGNGSRGTMQAGWAENGQQGRMRGSLWLYPEDYIKNSPFWQLNRAVTTPLRVTHGEKDDTVPVHSAIMTCNAMVRVGGQVECHIFPDEGHVIAGRDNRILEIEGGIAWFDEHVGAVRDAEGHMLFDGDRPRLRKRGVSEEVSDNKSRLSREAIVH